MWSRVWNLIAVAVLCAGAAGAGGCVGNRTLTDTDRGDLRNQPVIQVVRYTTPAPSVEAPKTVAAPGGKEIQGSLNGYDPTFDLSRRFSGMLARSAGLKNLRIERETAPLPPAKDTRGFQARYKNGAVLEIWIERWEFRSDPANIRISIPTLSARTRLTRVQDGRVLWNTGSCDYTGSGKNMNDRIALADLKSDNGKKSQAKFRRVLGQVTDSCAQQFLREFTKTK